MDSFKNIKDCVMPDKFSCIAVDDDKVFLAIIKAYISKTNFLEPLGFFTDPIKAVNFLSQGAVDIIFLDVNMPNMSGMEIIEALHPVPQVILISSSEEFAIEAFSHNATDYILKHEMTFARFLRATNKATRSIAKTRDGHMFVKVDKRMIRLNIDDINFIEAYGDYVKIHTKTGVHLILSSLKSIQEELPESAFARTHRSYLVRLNSIEIIEGNMIRFKDKIVPISKLYKQEFFKQIKIST